MPRQSYVYVMANRRNGTLYLGSTSNLPQRAHQHRNGLIDGFAKQHDCKRLVWCEAYDDIRAARHRELQMKKWKRSWKLRVIEELNPEWNDLYNSL
ncbi:GIY-YIG nuclease family protein [Parasphingopyxis sp.]|uniref:GIY-YIG nuclease family protein n=1 Tax=Parasphingopyxis sp. TaxID=1920299 RepID=UPI00262E90A1|nr:GIY-YIG nuclease family protein [Parasphingopyxis sp.]